MRALIKALLDIEAGGYNSPNRGVWAKAENACARLKSTCALRRARQKLLGVPFGCLGAYYVFYIIYYILYIIFIIYYVLTVPIDFASFSLLFTAALLFTTSFHDAFPHHPVSVKLP